MCLRDVVQELLTEKLVDDFYAQDRLPKTGTQSSDPSLEELKSLLPKEKWESLFLIESRTAELGAKELIRFANFVPRILLDNRQNDRPLEETI